MAPPEDSDPTSLEEATRLEEAARNAPGEAVERLPRLIELADTTVTDSPSRETRHRAASALAVLARERPLAVEDQYPDVVETLLDTEESMAVARNLMHSTASLVFDDLLPGHFAEGYREGLREAVSVVEDLDAATGRLPAGEVPGRGAAAIETAGALREHADTVSGREQLVVESLADGADDLVRLAASDLGLDAIDSIVDLRTARARSDGPMTIGLGPSGTDDAIERGWTRRTHDVIRYLQDGVFATLVVLHVERSAAQLLRVEAALAERVDIGL